MAARHDAADDIVERRAGVTAKLSVLHIIIIIITMYATSGGRNDLKTSQNSGCRLFWRISTLTVSPRFRRFSVCYCTASKIRYESSWLSLYRNKNNKYNRYSIKYIHYRSIKIQNKISALLTKYISFSNSYNFINIKS